MRFENVDGWAEPVCDWCGDVCNLDDVRAVDGQPVGRIVIDTSGECPELSCRCRFCKHDPVIHERQSDGTMKRVR
jgi:hypothetical protein